MSNRSVVALVGTLDTKGAEYEYLREVVAELGFESLLIDIGVKEPTVTPDVRVAETAQPGGRGPEKVGLDRTDLGAVLARAAADVLGELHESRRLAGVLGMGGSNGTALLAGAVQDLSIGVPKVIVSTLVGTGVDRIAGAADIVFVPAIVDVAGLNSELRRVLRQGAAILGALARVAQHPDPPARSRVSSSVFGNTASCVSQLADRLEADGVELLQFHANGVGGRRMERLHLAKAVVGCVDVTLTELADEECGGEFSAGPQRGHGAPAAGIPTVLVPGCVDMVNFRSRDSVPARYRDRDLLDWNALTTLMRTSPAENYRIGKSIGRAANCATGPVSVVVPTAGFSELGMRDGPFWDPPSDQACVAGIRATFRSASALREVDANINDAAFAEVLANEFRRLMDGAKGGSRS